jgi:uncharacterized protein
LTISVCFFSQGIAFILAVTEHLFDSRVVEFEKSEFKNPLVIGGFVGPSLVGVISASYVIEQLALHEIAHVRSPHIPPVTVFVGGKLRHPFRIYGNEAGDLVVSICEVPIGLTGLYEVSSVLLDWLEKIHPREIVVLDGIPVQGIPEVRKPFAVADESRVQKLKTQGVENAQAALITGMGGSILSECLSRRIPAISILSQASVTVPDPGAVLTVVDALNSVYGLSIQTKVLEQNVQQLNKELREITDQYAKMVKPGSDQDQPGAMYS